MPLTVRRLSEAARRPGWALSALNTGLQWQRMLGWEPAEFRRLARTQLSQIEGWRYRQDLALLYLLARDVPGPGVILEIGSYKGLATVALAYGARHGGHAQVHTVDPHTGDRQDLEARELNVLSSEADFRRNIERAGVVEEVVAYTMTSDELSSRWQAGEIRVLFIDGWHSYDAVASDLSNWVPRLATGGVVVVDDYLNYADVRAAVDNAAGILPIHVVRAGRMRLAHRQALPPTVRRFLRLRWG
jgi:predicted O-methyltransferase YrrM